MAMECYKRLSPFWRPELFLKFVVSIDKVSGIIFKSTRIEHLCRVNKVSLSLG